MLSHIREAFVREAYIATTALLDRLCERDESPWKDIRGKPLNDRGLASRLKGYGIKSKTVRVGDRTPKGYDAADFADVWRRYLPPASDIRHKGNSRHIFDNKNNFVADVAAVAAPALQEEASDAEEMNGFPELPKHLDRRPQRQDDGDPFADQHDPKWGLQPKKGQ